MNQEAPFQRGAVVDRYRLEDRLGAGAFGEVWRACQLADGQDVGVTCAIKLMRLSPDRTESSAREFATGWLEEVRNLVRVASESIPRILEAKVWNGHAYIAMELLAGSTLAARLQQGPLPWRRALFIAEQIARALRAAHQLGVTHRDLKPQNVVLVGPRRACVIDWGIATLNASTSQPAPPISVERRADADPDATDAGPVAPILTPRHKPVPIGTPGYMAPEVYEGIPPRPEHDVFALGVCLYEMLSGRLPHDVARPDRTNPDSVKAYRSSLDKATMDYSFQPLREVLPDVPPEVARLVDGLLDRDPARRPADVCAAIERAMRFPEGVPDPPYAGLVRLGPERAGLYFGQDDTIAHVLDRLRTQRAALLWGPSGSGKSSLALAGVAATMDRELFGDTDGWSIHTVRPREPEGFGVREEAEAGSRAAIGRVVVIDQLEEVVDLDEASRKAFTDAILALVDGTSAVAVRETTIGVADEVRLIATIRDDLEWRIDREVPALRPLLERRIIVKGVDANFARSIIEEPVRALGYEVEGIETISREVGERLSADPAKLPVVQYALSEWWERRDTAAKRLPLSAWRELGGVDGALSYVAERFYDQLGPDKQARVHAIFLRFFNSTRRQSIAVADLKTEDRELVDDLVRLRLLGRREHKGERPYYEVEHESLSVNWARLAKWLEEARDDRLLHDELQRDAATWVATRDPERLWKKRRLIAGEDLARRGVESVSADARSFLQAGRAAARRGAITLASIIAVLVLAIAGATAWQLRTLRDARNKAQAAEANATTEANTAKVAAERERNSKEAVTRALDQLKAADARAAAEEAAKKNAVNDKDAALKLAKQLEDNQRQLVEKQHQLDKAYNDLQNDIAHRIDKVGCESLLVEINNRCREK